MSDKHLALSLDYQIRQARLVKQLTAQNNQYRAILKKLVVAYGSSSPEEYKEIVKKIEGMLNEIP